MTLNALLEMWWIRSWMVYEEFQIREKKNTSLWVRLLMWMISLFLDAVLYYSSVHPEIFSPAAQSGMKLFCVIMIAIVRLPVFSTGVWSTFTLMAILDFFAGVSIILRYSTYKLLGLNLADYTVGDFRIMPLLVLIIFGILVHFTLIRWLHRFRNGLNHPGKILKVMNIFYWLPSLITVRPMDSIDLSNGMVVIISSVTGLAVVLGGWVYMAGYRKQISNENHYLAMQAELFNEHCELLQEQMEFAKMCKSYLQSEDFKMPGVEYLENADYYGKKAFTENRMLNTAVCIKIKQCESEHVNISVKLEDFRLLPGIEEIHLLTIFYNLFDNALEAAVQCKSGEKYINICGYTQEAAVHLSIENSVTPDRKLNKGLFTTKKDKANHGLGLNIVRDITKKYHGELMIRQEPGRFTAEAVLHTGK